MFLLIVSSSDGRGERSHIQAIQQKQQQKQLYGSNVNYNTIPSFLAMSIIHIHIQANRLERNPRTPRKGPRTVPKTTVWVKYFQPTHTVRIGGGLSSIWEGLRNSYENRTD